MWVYIVACTCIGTGMSYYVAGCFAARTMRNRRRSLMWVPVLAGVVGVALAFFVSAVSACLIAGVYVSIPFAIDQNVAIALGFAQAALITYAHLGRGYHDYKAVPLHVDD